jgi:hypothetical protein
MIFLQGADTSIEFEKKTFHVKCRCIFTEVKKRNNSNNNNNINIEHLTHTKTGKHMHIFTEYHLV